MNEKIERAIKRAIIKESGTFQMPKEGMTLPRNEAKNGYM